MTEKSRRGSSGRGIGHPLGAGSGEREFFEFSSKNAGFYSFLLQKTVLVARNRDWEALIDTLCG